MNLEQHKKVISILTAKIEKIKQLLNFPVFKNVEITFKTSNKTYKFLLQGNELDESRQILKMLREMYLIKRTRAEKGYYEEQGINLPEQFKIDFEQ